MKQLKQNNVGAGIARPIVKANKGITLVALVITIIVLLILAGITISLTIGEDGIIRRAQEAGRNYQEAAQNENTQLAEFTNMADNIIGNLTGGGSGTPPGPEKTRIEELMETVATDNETVLDKYGNKIRIPAGFKIVANGTKENDNNMVEYTYDKQNGTSTNVPVVQDGIVIKNATDGNEFVWVPVGEIKNDAEPNTTNKTTITLGRYENFSVINNILPTPVQVASKTTYNVPTKINDSTSYDWIEIPSDFAGNGTYGAASSYNNTKAYNLREWISTTLDNGGYYIARYEASKNGEKAASKVSTGTPVDEETGPTTIYDGMLWTCINQSDAARVSKAMYPYSGEAKYYSDLINSYAWDTAIIFIEAYSGDADYADQEGPSINGNRANTGINNDKRCNIHDMAGNVEEFTTETYTDSYESYVIRGSYFESISGRSSTSHRDVTAYGFDIISFRSTLCVK